MRPGAPMVLETINPACWMAFFETYIRDVTHKQPLHPETLRYLVQASGFTSVDVQFRSPVRESDRLARVCRTRTAVWPARRPRWPSVDRRGERSRREAELAAVLVDGLRDHRETLIWFLAIIPTPA